MPAIPGEASPPCTASSRPGTRRRAGVAHRRRSAWGRRSCSAICCCAGPTNCFTAADCPPMRCCGPGPCWTSCAPKCSRDSTWTCSGRRAATGPWRARCGWWSTRPPSTRLSARSTSARSGGATPAATCSAEVTPCAPVAAAYAAYGLPLGVAFQLRDDILGVFGDPGQTGKPAGDDLREGKRTVLLAITRARATANQAAVIDRHLGNPLLDDAGTAEVRDVITGSGALAECERMIDRHVAKAHAALAAAPIAGDVKDALAELA